MINFPCKCGHPYSVPDDQAGGLIQCPNCGLLADIPTLSDLANLNDDGTFAFEESTPVDTLTAADLHRVYSTHTHNSQGVEKDLRPNANHFKVIGTQDQAKARPAPRYDPVTGELIRPLELKDEEPTPVLSIGTLVDPNDIELEEDPQPVQVLRIPAAPVLPAHSLAYAMGDARKHVTLSTLGLELLMPANAIVIFFIFLLYVVGYYINSLIGRYAPAYFPVVWPFVLVNLPIWVVLAHLGCTIEDVGPDATDELPRPLRNFSLGEDLINPLFHILLSGVLCFWPAVLACRNLNLANPQSMAFVLILAMVGSAAFPAVLLTAVTGSTVLNLRPDRLLNVVRLSGGNYLISILLFLLCAIPSLYFLAGDLLFADRLTGPFFQQLAKPRVMLPAIFMTVYFLHFFCWHLALMYRENHSRFGWVAQFHIKRNDSARRASLAD